MKFVWVAALAAALSGAPAYAEEFGVPLDVPNGSVIELTIEKNGEHSENGETTPIGDLVFHYRQEIAATDQGYTVSQTFQDMKLPDKTSAKERAAIEAGMAATRHIAYDTDRRLSPVRIHDADAIISAITSDGPNASPTPERLKAQEKAAAMFRRMDPKYLAATLMNEQVATAAYQGVPLPLGETLETESEEPNPFGSGPPVKARSTVTLKSVDRDKGVAIVETSKALDPASLAAMLSDAFRKMTPDARAPSAEELAQLKYERNTTCRYEIDLQSGLASTSECTDVKGAADGTGSRRSVERMRITQKLIRPAG